MKQTGGIKVSLKDKNENVLYEIILPSHPAIL